MKPVLILITFDVDPADNLGTAVDLALKLLKKNKIRATFFFAAAHADRFMVQKVAREGHEVACHGLEHNDEEEFNKLGEERQREILTQATNLLGSLAGAKPTSFRAPRVKVSVITLKILEELGFKVDSSVCSQRLDFLSSNLVNPGWIFAPRKPYHPHQDSPYRRGTMKILEVPPSALILPFVSTALRIFGVALMKLFFKVLYWESRLTGKPIVYLVHPHEFIYGYKLPFHWRMLIPNRRWLIDGSPLRRWLSRRYLGEKVYAMNQQLFSWIAAKHQVTFLTMSDYWSVHRD